MPCRRSGKPRAVKPDEQPSNGVEPRRSGSDVKAEGIPNERRKGHRVTEIPGGEAKTREACRKEGRTSEGTKEGTGRKKACGETAWNSARPGGTQHEMDARTVKLSGSDVARKGHTLHDYR